MIKFNREPKTVNIAINTNQRNESFSDAVNPT